MQTGQPFLASAPEQARDYRGLGMARTQTLFKALTYVLLWGGALVLMVPFFWMLSTSLKTLDEVQTWPIVWIPRNFLWENYPEVFERTPFARYLLNSLIISVGGIIGTIVGSSLAGYGFARMRFPGRDLLFFINLTTLMLPAWVVIVPHFMMFSAVGWLDTYLPIIVPAFFGNPFHIFLYRQTFLGIPRELEDAAQIDGCSRLRIFLQIFMPMSKPATATVAIFAFYYYWNDLIYPLVYLQSQMKFPVSLGLRMFQTSNAVVNMPLMMAASVMALLPCVVLFLLAQRLFIQGVVITGVEK
ncbi:MAG TPA: carbohydrate ABC transporter permease [Caldilineaceae bacterium]|nr:carbohydrate ABC transporter permease [Caldilineaceae bacterium]